MAGPQDRGETGAGENDRISRGRLLRQASAGLNYGCSGGQTDSRKIRCMPIYTFELQDGERVYEIPFAHVDPTLDHLLPPLRMRIEASCESIRSARQIIFAARATVRESQALVARSRGEPYLATILGNPTIRMRASPAGRGNRAGRRPSRAE
jgi:hypothetical protein